MVLFRTKVHYLSKKMAVIMTLLMVGTGLILIPTSVSAKKPIITGDAVFEYSDKNVERGGIFNSSIPTAPRSLDPHMESTSQTARLACNIYNSLVTVNQTNDDVELDLAKSWKQLDPLTYEFKIHEGVYFQNIPPVNGRELTSADVKYSIERVSGMHGKGRFAHRSYFEDRIASIETQDKYTIIFKTKKPYAPFLMYLGSGWSCIVPKEAVETFKDLRRKAIGSGPFILEEAQSGSHYILTKNPNYFKKDKPYLDKIHIRIMQDISGKLAAFLAKKLDKLGVYPSQIEILQKSAPEVIIKRTEGLTRWTLGLSVWRENKPLKAPFNNKKVRHAIAMAIDKDKLLRMSWQNQGTVQIGPVPKSFAQYSLSDREQIEYNPEKAKKLLSEAGYTHGFSTQMITWNQTYMTTPAQVIQAMLKDVGINANLRLLELAQWYNLNIKGDYELNLYVSSSGFDPFDYLSIYQNGEAQKMSAYRWNNNEISNMIEKQLTTLDTKKRAYLTQEIQKKIIEDAPDVFLYSIHQFEAYWPYVHTRIWRNYHFGPLHEYTWMEKH